MVIVILLACLLYLIQLMLHFRFARETTQRANALKGFQNLAESIPIFFVLGVLSVLLDVGNNTFVGSAWVLARTIFVIVYVSGVGRKPMLEDGSEYEPQPPRSLAWLVSILLLVWMAINVLTVN